MRWIVLLVAAPALAFDAQPAQPRQGDTIHLRGPRDAASARMAGRTVRLFPEGEDNAGLMPVPALQKPGAYSLEFLSGDGTVLGKLPVVVRNAGFPKERLTLSRQVTSLKPSPGEVDTSLEFRGLVTDTRYWAEPLAVPIPGCRSTSYGVGRIVNGRLATDYYHAGFDMHGQQGEPVHATAAGTVRVVKEWNVHGNTVGIDHGQGLASMYLHLSSFAVTEGQQVQQGDVVGYVGSTGRSTGPHLHWTLYAFGVPVNPGQWVTVKACAASRPAVRRRASAAKKK